MGNEVPHHEVRKLAVWSSAGTWKLALRQAGEKNIHLFNFFISSVVLWSKTYTGLKIWEPKTLTTFGNTGSSPVRPEMFTGYPTAKIHTD